MDDIDAILARLRDLPLDARLDSIDGAVLAGLVSGRPARLSVPAVAMVAALSLAIGVAGSYAPADRRPAAAAFPLGAAAALAPSTLLGSGE